MHEESQRSDRARGQKATAVRATRTLHSVNRMTSGVGYIILVQWVVVFFLSFSFAGDPWTLEGLFLHVS